MRKQEIRNLSALTYLIFGVFVVVAFFPKHIANLSLIFLAVGDPLASIFGILYGKDKIIKNKSLQGSIAAFFVCSIAACFYFLFYDIMTDRLILISLVSGAIGMIAELLPIGKIDDNFTFPVISATLLWILSSFFGGIFNV